MGDNDDKRDEIYRPDRSRNGDRYEIDRMATATVRDLREELALLNLRLEYLKEEITKLVTKLEFAPVKILVYGLAATMLSGIMAAILAQIFRHP